MSFLIWKESCWKYKLALCDWISVISQIFFLQENRWCKLAGKIHLRHLKYLKPKGSVGLQCVNFLSSLYLFVIQVLNKEEQELAAKNEYNFDHPDAFDFELLVNILRKLKKGKSIKVPVYDFTTHSRRKEWVRPSD